MASWMRVWLGIVLGGVFLIGLWGLPPRTESEWLRGPRRARVEHTPEWEAHARLQRTVRSRHWVFQRLQWRDSLERVVRTAQEAGKLEFAALPKTAPEHYLPRLRDAIRIQLAFRGAPEPRVPVGAVLMDVRVGLHPLVQQPDPGLSYGRELFVSRVPDNPYCVVVDPVYPTSRQLRNDWARMVWAPPDSSVPPNALGLCALFAKFGTPGPEVFEWLTERGYAFGQGGRRAWEGAFDPDQRPSRGAFGIRTSWYTYSPHGEACLAGDVDGCARALEEDRSRRSSPRNWRTYGLGGSSPVVIRNLDTWSYPLFGGGEADLLWDLQNEYGPERFLAFWGSELGVEEAFQAAFATTFPEWVMGWAQREVGVLEASPTVPPVATLLSLVTIAGFAAFGLRRGRRRG